MPVEITLMGQAAQHPQLELLLKAIPKRVVNHFRALGLTDPELSIVFCDDTEIQKLNKTWRDLDEATDVLSFPLHEPDTFPADVEALGDIVVSLEYAERLVAQESHRSRVAESLGVTPDSFAWDLLEEVTFLVIHGLLHLVGHDHAEPQEEAEMRSEERRLWDSSGGR